MSIASALSTLQDQLAYWKQEREAACRNDDIERVARCDKFISQCELIMSALRDADRTHDSGNGRQTAPLHDSG